MDDISCVLNFDNNENCPILESLKVNDILNKSTERLAAESVAFAQSTPLAVKQILTSVNNNFKNEESNIGFTIAGNSTECTAFNSEENVTLLCSAALTGKAKSINSSSLANETLMSIQTSGDFSFKSVQNVSGCENEFESDSFAKSACPCADEFSAGNVNFLPDTLSDEVFGNNQKKLSNNGVECTEMSKSEIDSITKCVELKHESNDVCLVTQDLVDFSFRKQENVTDDLLGSFAVIDSVSKQPEPFPSGTEDISNIGYQENKPASTSAKLLENESVNKAPESPIINLEVSVIEEATKNDTIALQDSTNASPFKMSNNPEKEFAGYDIAIDNMSVELLKPNIVGNEIFVIDSVKLDASTNNEYLKANSNETAFQMSENTSINEPDETSPLKVGKVSLGMSDKSIENFDTANASINEPDETSLLKVGKVSLGMSDKSIENFDTANASINEPNEISPLKVKKGSLGMSDKSIENFDTANASINEPNEISPLKVGKVSLGMSDKPFEEFDISVDNGYKEINSDETAFQVPENDSKNETDAVSPLQAEKVSFGMSDKPLEQLADPEFAFKMPEVPSDIPFENFPGPDFVFKMPEVPSNNSLDQFFDPDFAFKVPEVPSNNLLRNSNFTRKTQENSLINEGDEQFVDAVQFFKDPNSFKFLENIRTSTIQSGSPVPRSSLYINFDPLHSKFQNVPKHDNCELISTAVQGNNASDGSSEKCNPEVVKKHLANVAARESIGNILISFDSPKSSTSADSKIPIQSPAPPKMLTEEEHQHKLKIHELETQEAYLKKQKEMEMQIAKRDELLVIQKMVVEELSGILEKLSEEIKKGNEKIMSLETENEKLKEDIKTSSEDLLSVENTFTDFYKRYEQCKSLLKSFKDNEEHLKQTISDLRANAKEQDHMYSLLKERTEEMLEKANVEMDNVKRSGEAQLTVLKAQLKKAEMRISSLESDNKQMKMENCQLGGICDDLMAKVSRS